MNKTTLFTQPDHDFTTRYLSEWSNKIKELAESRGNSTICLKSDRANKKEFESMIQKTQPHFIILNGHGDYDRITGQNMEVILKADDNEHIIKGTVVYTVSCKSAKTLGVKSVEKGTKAYIGYKEDFWFYFDNSKKNTPLLDKTAKIFLECSNQFGISLLKGNTVGVAFEFAKKAYKKAIIEQIISNSPDSNSYLPLLMWDYTHLTLEGDKSYKL